MLKNVWPEREVVGVNLDILPWLGGGVHCATLHWPAVEVDAESGVDGKEDEL